MSTISVSRLPGYYFSLCTGRALSLPFKHLGKSWLQSCFPNRDIRLCHYMSILVTQLKLCFQDVGIVPCSKCNLILFFSGQDNDINLMKACWNELFALGLAQCSSIMNVGTILSAIINHLQTSLQEGRRAVRKVERLNVMQRRRNNVLLCGGGVKHHGHRDVAGSLC